MDGGMTAIKAAIEKLSKTHAEHIAQYGSGAQRPLHVMYEHCFNQATISDRHRHSTAAGQARMALRVAQAMRCG